MGTTKSGRYLNTQGSGIYISRFTLVHANEGDFTKPKKKDDRLRLKAGGHGQKGMELLDKYGIEYHIVHTYTNGVRVGNIPRHKEPIKRKGINQSWFPKEWTEKTIEKAGQHVMRIRQNKKSNDNPSFAWYKGVKVGIFVEKGKVKTIFPDNKQERRKK